MWFIISTTDEPPLKRIEIDRRKLVKRTYSLPP